MNPHAAGSLPVRKLPHLSRCQQGKLVVIQRNSGPVLKQAQDPGPGWHLSTGKAALPAIWMADPLTVDPAHPRLPADEDLMLSCLAVEAACLPRPRRQPLPRSLRSPPLHGACITRCFVSGDSKPPAHCPHVPAFQPWSHPSQPTWPKASQ